MTGARCIPVALVATAFVAMAGRVGWIPWAPLDIAGAVAAAVVGLLVLLMAAALVIGVPAVLITMAVAGFCKLFPARPDGARAP